MRGAATQAMSVYIVEERQRSRCPPAAAPFQAAARRALLLPFSAPIPAAAPDLTRLPGEFRVPSAPAHRMPG